MNDIKTKEIRAILLWIIGKLERQYGDCIPIEQDFYRIPLDLNWFFHPETPLGEEAFGSFGDEIDLLRKSVLFGEEDLPDVVMERVGYLLLYLAYQAEQARSR